MISKQNLSKYKKLFKKSKVLCIGDLMLDQYVYGEVNRISPEAPVPIILVNDKISILGGAGNVASNISKLGGYVNLLCIIGEDEISKKAKSLIKNKNNFLLSPIKDKKFKLPIKTRYINKSNQLLRVDEENVSYIDTSTQNKVLKKFRAIIKDYDVVVLSDYCKGILDKKLIKEIIGISEKNQVQTIIDPKSKDFSIYCKTDYITPNDKELIEAMKIDAQDKLNDTNIIKLCRKVINQYSIKNIILTRSDKGIMLVNKDKSYNYPAYAREVYDVTGAGDTVLAMLALCISKKINMSDALHLANYAAGIVVGKSGTATINFNEIQQFIANEK